MEMVCSVSFRTPRKNHVLACFSSLRVNFSYEMDKIYFSMF